MSSNTGDTCYGDSGGPLLVIGSGGVARVAGVLDAGLSDGDDECGAGAVGIYAPIVKNLDLFATRGR